MNRDLTLIPWTAEEMAKLQATGVKNFMEEVRSQDAEIDEKDIVFTCDHCRYKYSCEFVYDTYNTDGDCLAEK